MFDLKFDTRLKFFSHRASWEIVAMSVKGEKPFVFPYVCFVLYFFQMREDEIAMSTYSFQTCAWDCFTRSDEEAICDNSATATKMAAELSTAGGRVVFSREFMFSTNLFVWPSFRIKVLDLASRLSVVVTCHLSHSRADVKRASAVRCQNILHTKHISLLEFPLQQLLRIQISHFSKVPTSAWSPLLPSRFIWILITAFNRLICRRCGLSIFVIMFSQRITNDITSHSALRVVLRAHVLRTGTEKRVASCSWHARHL